MKLKQKPNGIYFIEYEGPDETGEVKRRRISLDTRDPDEARRQKQQWSAGMHPKQNMVREPKPEPLVSPTEKPKGWTVRRALERCEDTVWRSAKAQASIRSNIKIVNSYVGDELVADMCYDRIEELIRQFRQEGYAPGTIKRKLDVLSKAVSMSSVWKDPATGKPYITGKPKWPELKFDNTQDREVWPHEEAAIFKAIDARIQENPNRPWWRFRCFVRVLLDTGLRLGEAIVLDNAHIITQPVLNPETGKLVHAKCISLRREETKNGKPRIVPISPEVEALIPALEQQSGKGKWFPWKKGSATPWYMWDNIRDDLTDAGMELSDVKLHTFRHTCANRLRRRGVPLELLQKWLGHHDISVTAGRYLHIDATDLIVGAGFASNSSGSTTEEEDGGLSAKQDHPVSRTNRDIPGTARLQ